MKLTPQVEGRLRGTKAVTLTEGITLGTRPPPNQKAETEFGTTKFTNNPPFETHKIPRTTHHSVPLTREFTRIHSHEYFSFFHSCTLWDLQLGAMGGPTPDPVSRKLHPGLFFSTWIKLAFSLTRTCSWILSCGSREPRGPGPWQGRVSSGTEPIWCHMYVTSTHKT